MQTYQLRIDGRCRDSSTGEFFDSFDPFTGKPWASVALSLIHISEPTRPY